MTHHHHHHGHHHHGHHHHHEYDEECCCCCDDHCDLEHHHHHHHENQDFAAQLLEMADDAWMELLKEKIKKQIESAGGKHLDHLAKIVAESNKERWEHKLAINELASNYKEKLTEFFGKGRKK
jgi:hypothetical protein